MDKKAYREKQEAQLKEWQAEINKLKAQTQKKSAEAKITLGKQIEELDEKKQQIKENLDALQDVSEDRWEEVRRAYENKAEELAEKLKELKQ